MILKVLGLKWEYFFFFQSELISCIPAQVYTKSEGAAVELGEGRVKTQSSVGAWARMP